MTNLKSIEPTYTLKQLAERSSRSYATIMRDIKANRLATIQHSKNGRRAVTHSEAVRYCNGMEAA